jgi:hypothetical protein
VPNRAFRAVEAHELNQSEAWVLFWLIYRCGRDGGETAFTLKGLAAESRWGKSAEALRQTLHALQEKQWIDADPPSSRGVSTWRVSLKAAKLAPRNLEGSSKEPPTGDAPTPHPDVDSDSKQPPSANALKEKEQEQDFRPLTAEEIEVLEKSNLPLPPSVLEALTGDSLGVMP